MKRTYLLLILLWMLTSCTSTLTVTSIEQYNESIQMVSKDFSNAGYELSGHKNERSSNTIVTGVSYSTHTGYGTAMDNDVFNYETYTFSNTNGDIAEISLKYRERYSEYSEKNYLETVELLGCSASKSSDYNKICGSASRTKQLLGNMQRDIDVSVYDKGKTEMLGYSILLVVCLLPLLLLL